MNLNLFIHPVSEIVFGDATSLESQRLVIDRDQLSKLVLEDRRLEGVDLEIASPGESWPPPRPPRWS